MLNPDGDNNIDPAMQDDDLCENFISILLGMVFTGFFGGWDY